MQRFLQKCMIISGCVVVCFSLQGCDQINKFIDYLSPKSADQEEARPASASLPAGKTKSATVKDPVSQPDVEEKTMQQPQETAPNVLAQVGDWKMTLEEFNKRLEVVQATVPEFDPTNIDQKKYILSELVQQQLLVQEALARQLDKTEQVSAAIDDFRNTVLVQALGAKITEGLEVTDQEAEAFYTENPDFFKTLTEWKVREIVVPSEEKAKNILVSLNQGASFEDIAKAQSISQSAGSGGDLGFLTIPTGDPALDGNAFPFEKMMQTVSALDIGGVSGAFQGPEGYYIVTVEDMKGGELQALEEVREDLKQYLLAGKQQQLLIDTLTAAQEKYGVNINENLLEE